MYFVDNQGNLQCTNKGERVCNEEDVSSIKTESRLKWGNVRVEGKYGGLCK